MDREAAGTMNDDVAHVGLITVSSDRDSEDREVEIPIQSQYRRELQGQESTISK